MSKDEYELSWCLNKISQQVLNKIPLDVQGGGGAGGWMPLPIRFFFNFFKKNFYQHLSFSVAVRMFMDTLWQF